MQFSLETRIRKKAACLFVCLFLFLHLTQQQQKNVCDVEVQKPFLGVILNNFKSGFAMGLEPVTMALKNSETRSPVDVLHQLSEDRIPAQTISSVKLKELS